MTEPEVHDHVRSGDGDYTPGVYRVVGVGEESVALLRVADADGRRVNTGELVHADPDDLREFDPAEDPDAGFTPVRTLREGVEGLRILLRGLVGR